MGTAGGVRGRCRLGHVLGDLNVTQSLSIAQVLCPPSHMGDWGEQEKSPFG